MFRSLSCLIIAATLTACSAGDPLVLDAPVGHGALITGSIQTMRWHGGAPSDTVDIHLIPTVGNPIVLAANLPNSGTAEVPIHLLSDEARRGGTLEVVRSSTAHAQSITPLRQALTPDLGASGLQVGSLAGFSWTGTSEEYYWLDVLTGEKKTLGTVGDLESWTMRTLAVNQDSDEIFILGFHGAQQKLYVLDSKTGTLVRDPAVAGSGVYSGLNVRSDGAVLAFAWNNSTRKEEMVTIDGTTGATNIIGTVGDLESWSNQTAYDPDHETMYVLGFPPGGSRTNLYSLNATTGALLGQRELSSVGGPVNALLGLVATKTGELIAFRWNGSVEEMVRIDPATGEVTVRGTVGDLEFWSDIAQIDRDSGTIYVVGTNAASKDKMWVLDATTGALRYDVAVAAYPTSAVLVY